MFELRILSGLHRGATLPLDEHTLVIGADDDADVVLVDPGIETRHATLAPTADGWTLSTLDGAVLGQDHNRPLATLELRDGDFARLGHVWLCVAGQDAPWENPPPEPAHGDAGDGAMDDDGQQASPYPAGMDELDGNEPYSDSPLDDPLHTPAAGTEPALSAPAAPEPTAANAATAGAAAAKPAAAKSPPVKAAKAGTARGAGWRRWKMLLVPTVLVTILSACAAYSINSHPEDEAAPAASRLPAPRGAAGPAAELAAALPGALPAGQPASLPPGPPPAPAPEKKVSQHELRDAFRNRLKEVDLLKRFNLDLRDGEWTMQASLDAEEAARFDRILKAFVQAHNIKFPVHAKVGGAEVMLPFRVREVISGANASIVTQDGKRLYVGDEHRGLRLVAVDGHHLQFDGERKIKVKW